MHHNVLVDHPPQMRMGSSGVPLHVSLNALTENYINIMEISDRKELDKLIAYSKSFRP